MKNIFKFISKKLELYSQGYNSGELTADKTWEIVKKSYLSLDNKVWFKIREVENLIVACSKEHKTSTVFIVPESEDKEVIDATIKHFQGKGFKIIKQNLGLVGETETEFVIISWKHNEIKT